MLLNLNFAIRIPLTTPPVTLCFLSPCFHISNRSVTLTSTQVVISADLKSFFFNYTSEFSLLFHFIPVNNCCLVKNSVIFIYSVNQILASLIVKVFLVTSC